MRVLVACEESQEVCKAFRALGHEAYSCDIQEPSGGHPEWHIHGDALIALEGGQVTTMDGVTHDVGKWDLLIAHPPCTDLAVSGARYFPEKRRDGRQQRSIEFFYEFVNADVPLKAIENPVCIMSTVWRKPDQIINPYQFGHAERKRTCLWLTGLPPLRETHNVYNKMIKLPKKSSADYTGSGVTTQKSGLKLSPASPVQWRNSGEANAIDHPAL